MRQRLLLIVFLAAGILAFGLGRGSSVLAAPPAAIQGLHVSGNTIVNAANQPVRLLGVNRSGTEYMCIQGRGIFDGPNDQASISAMLTWKVNAVRVPLNEDCWLNINGVNASFGGATYQQAIIDYVNLLNNNGIIAIVELHWSAPGTTQATGQNPMPDSDHSPAFWTQVANTFKGNSSVIFDLFNEPFPDNNSDTAAAWLCWKSGGTCSQVSYPVAGMQTLVDTVRATGATNIIMLGGVEFSNSLTQWLGNKPTDATGNLVAAWHSYNFNICSSLACWQSTILPVLQQVPLVAGEIGENDCAHGYIDQLMSFLDANNASYLAWTWDNWSGACATGPVLLLDYTGAPTAYGQGYRDHLLSIVPSGTNTPTFTASVGPSPTATRTSTSTPTINPNATIQVQIRSNGPDSNQQTGFAYQIRNVGTTAASGLSVRVYFTLDGSNPASNYTLEKYFDQSGSATVSGPTQASGNVYYFTVTYGTALAAGGSWEYQTALHTSNWAQTFDGSNDWFHTGYAVGALPASYTNHSYLPAFAGGSLVWGLVPGGTPSNTPTNTQVTFQPPSNTPSRTLTSTIGPSATPTSTRTNTATFTPSNVASATATRTNTATATTGPSATPSRTNTSTMTFTSPPPGGLNVQIKNNGTDGNQQTAFAYNVRNTGTTAVSGITIRIYFTLDGSNPASNYTLEKYYDQSGSATVSGPTQASGNVYYFTVTYGTALAAGASWEYQTALHTANWAQTFDGSNDWFHSGYAVGALPAAYTNTNFIPAFVNGSLVWGQTPAGGGTPTNTSTVGPSPTASRTNTPTFTSTVGPSPTPSRTNTSTFTPTIGPSMTPTRTNTATMTPSPGTHLANPFVGATWYVNPDWASEVNAEAAIQGGTLGATMTRVAKYNTFVWLDSIDAVNGTNGYARSLAGHLDAALAQGANLIGIVIYDLPNRDCSALASNGELLIAQNGMNRYKTEYIDVIANTFASKPAYANLRIVAVIEPDSLPNLVTNLSFAKCQEANGPGGYVEGTQYTLNKLHPFSNFYAYIDIGHAGWLGWDPSNFTPAVNLISNAILGTTAGGNSIDGFISNTANTSVVTEPFMTANQTISGNPVRSADFYQWNQFIDEGAYDAAWKSAMAAKGVKNGMLVDTSRNGWGGCGGGPAVSQPCRPTGPSTSTDLNTFVNATRTDRRPAKGDWCNQNGAGIGAVPQANPPDAGGVYQAFVWVKPPGESDGSSSLIPPGPDNPGGKGFDQMCDPNYGGNALNNNKPTNALPNAPVSGRWFEAQFVQLVQNAFPPIP